jgi:TolA-binding protein
VSVCPPASRLTGTTLAHYRILDPLGEGGTAVVYRAEDLMLGRLVALKLLPASITGDLGTIARFQHEARTISTLSHPNICTIYEIGDCDGRQYIAMEYLEGRPLSKVLDNRALEPYRLVELAIQIADGLEAAHEARVVHRDLKPANIQVSARDHVTLLDFGLATLLPFGVSRNVTAAEPWMCEGGGTGPYMSPEQTLGEAVDTRSDLFSFGVVLYEMATGVRPFTAATPAALAEAIRSERPLPARDLNTAVPEALDRIITKALEKQRKLRYQTASDMAADLRRLKRDLDTSHAAAPPPAGRADDAAAVTSRRKPPARVFGGRLLEIATAAAVGGVVVSLGLPVLVEWHVGRATAVSTAAAARPGAELHKGPGAAPAAPAASATDQHGALTAGQNGGSAARTAAGMPAASSPALAAPAAGATATTRLEAAPGAAGSASGLTALTPEDAVAAEREARVVDALRIAEAKAGLQLYDQALDTLRQAVATAPDSRSAPAAYLRIATIHQARGAADEAIAGYLEVATRYPKEALAAEALFRMAEAIQASRRKDRDQEARAAYSQIAAQHARSPFAARALMARATLEDRDRLTLEDSRLGRRVPASLASYREVVERHPRSPEREHALWQLASRYEDLEAWVDACAALETLGGAYPRTRYDVWFTAGEIAQKRLKDPARALRAFARVPATSPHYRDAQKRLTDAR